MDKSRVEQTVSLFRNYLVRFQGIGNFETIKGSKKAKLKGELCLEAVNLEFGRIGLRMKNMGIVGTGLILEQGETGQFSMSSQVGRGYLSDRDGRSSYLRLNFTSRGLYEAIRHELGVIEAGPDLTLPHEEVFSGTLEGYVRPRTIHGQPALVLSSGTIKLIYQKGGLGWIKNLTISLRSVPLHPLNMDALEGSQCPPEHTVPIRCLRIQPVGFQYSENDTNPTGTSLVRQFEAAERIWGKCCIRFDVQPIHMITIDGYNYKTSGNAFLIMEAYDDPDPNTIEVFFVANNLTSDHGGVTDGGGSDQAKIVITDNNCGNPNLLAHELGHVLGGKHPGEPVTGVRWNGDHDTILEPSNSASIPNPDKNTHNNCIRARATNPALVTLSENCCLTHDITDHYIRDFPEDVGTEPNVAPPGRNFYSMSNLWNRHGPDPGGTNPDGTPQHQQPVRFNSDGTPFQNKLFAKVEAIENLPSKDVEVKFLLKHPGAGGGGNFILLGTAPVDEALSPGSPQVVPLPWTVPSGIPQHSCLFAAVRSPSEPEEDVFSMGFSDLAQLVRRDNDWVQRNLDISDYPPDAGVGGASVWTAPVLLSYPRESSHANPLPVRLEVNARKARPLRNIVLELRGEPVYRIPSGKTTSLRLKGKISPGRHLLLALRAELPAKAAIGETYQIEINPQLGNLSLQGYNFTLRISTPARALGQILDIATGVYQDLVEMRGSEPAFVLLEAHRDLLAFRPQISGNLVNVLKYRDRLAVAALGRELGRLGVARTVSLRPSLESLLDALDTNASTHTILSAYRNFIGRLQLLVFLLFRA